MQVDTDSDDTDDGIADTSVAFPLNAAESADLDGDGIDDNADTDILEGANAKSLNKSDTFTIMDIFTVMFVPEYLSALNVGVDE